MRAGEPLLYKRGRIDESGLMRMPFPYNSSPYFFFPPVLYLDNKLNIFFDLASILSFFLCQSPRIVWKWINLTNIIIWLMFFLLVVFISICMRHRFLCSVSGRIGSDRRWFGYPAMRYESAVIGRCHLPCCLVPRTQQEADLHVSNIFVTICKAAREYNTRQVCNKSPSYPS